MATFRVPPGGKITIAIDEGVVQPAPSRDDGPEYIGVEPGEDQTYVFKKGGLYNVYDLGMRLRSVPAFTFDDSAGLRIREFGSQEIPAANNGDLYINEYVDQRCEVAATLTVLEYGTNPEPPPDVFLDYHVSITTGDYAKLERMLMGSLAPTVDGETKDALNPTSYYAANGTGRKLSASAPVMRRSTQSFQNDDGLLHVDSDLPTTPAPITNRTPDAVKDPIERWNPYNTGHGINYEDGVQEATLVADDLAFRSMDLATAKELTAEDFTAWDPLTDIYTSTLNKPLKVVRAHLDDEAPVPSRYYDFNTARTDAFKVTGSNTYASAAVAYSFKKTDAIYLRPRLVAYIVNQGVDLETIHATWVGIDPRCPPESRRDPGSAPEILHVYNWHLERSLVSHWADWHENQPSFFDVPDIKTFLSSGIDDTNRKFTFDDLPIGSLIAIIARGKKLFFVWTKLAITEENQLDISRNDEVL